VGKDHDRGFWRDSNNRSHARKAGIEQNPSSSNGLTVAQRYLFRTTTIFDVTQGRQRQLRDALGQMSLSALNDEQLPVKLANDYGLDVPILDEANKYATQKEVNVDVSQDMQRRILDRSKPFLVPATEITIHVPFNGDHSLFDVRPTTFNSNPPSGDCNDHELLLVFTIIESRDITPELEQSISEVRQHLEWLRTSEVQLVNELRQLAISTIGERKQRTAAHEDILGRLGIPFRQGEVPQLRPAAAAPSGKKAIVSQHGHGRWDFFISHASEDKQEIARPLADALREKGQTVWYDEFSLNVGDTLIESIDLGLASSRFGVVILSPHFFEKHWPKQELSGLATREVNGSKVILPVWHRIGVDEVRANSPTLAGRIAVSTDKGLDHVVQRLLAAAGTSTGGLPESRAQHEELIFEESVYWKRKNGAREGPYCPVCYDDKHKAIHLNPGATKGTYGCGACRNSFRTNEYDPRPHRRRPFSSR